jgi:hypothetical protein
MLAARSLVDAAAKTIQFAVLAEPYRDNWPASGWTCAGLV